MMAMIAALDPDHPKHVLLFFLEQDINDAIRQKMKEFVEQLAGIKEWVNGPPCFVDELEEVEDETPLETVGCYVELYSGWSPWKVPREIDLAQLQDVEVLVAALSQFSRENKLTIMLQYAGEEIGEIEDGVMDEGVSVVLIGEWRRGLELES
jgi:hypothetical protein